MDEKNIQTEEQIVEREMPTQNNPEPVSNASKSFLSDKKNIVIVALAAIVVIVLLITMVGGGSGSGTPSGDGGNTGMGTSNTDKEEEFYTLVAETQDLLDAYADDIYQCWYDYVYNDEYSSVDSALFDAYLDNYSNCETIDANTEVIKNLYKEIKDGKLSDEVKAVMQAYNEYYSFVMEVSGSFNSYSAGKETAKKALSNALKNLSFELD